MFLRQKLDISYKKKSYEVVKLLLHGRPRGAVKGWVRTVAIVHELTPMSLVRGIK